MVAPLDLSPRDGSILLSPYDRVSKILGDGGKELVGYSECFEEYDLFKLEYQPRIEDAVAIS